MLLFINDSISNQSKNILCLQKRSLYYTRCGLTMEKSFNINFLSHRRSSYLIQGIAKKYHLEGSTWTSGHFPRYLYKIKFAALMFMWNKENRTHFIQWIYQIQFISWAKNFHPKVSISRPKWSSFMLLMLRVSNTKPELLINCLQFTYLFFFSSSLLFLQFKPI